MYAYTNRYASGSVATSFLSVARHLPDHLPELGNKLDEELLQVVDNICDDSTLATALELVLSTWQKVDKTAIASCLKVKHFFSPEDWTVAWMEAEEKNLIRHPLMPKVMNQIMLACQQRRRPAQ